MGYFEENNLAGSHRERSSQTIICFPSPPALTIHLTCRGSGSLRSGRRVPRLALTVRASCMGKWLSCLNNRSAVAVLAILRSKTKAFPLSTVVIEQYRPPIDKFIIGTCHRSFEEISDARLL
jgi:hypothetical protein